MPAIRSALASGSLALKGINGYVASPASLISNYTSMTIETWVKALANERSYSGTLKLVWLWTFYT
jgi:hypothetical protein